MQLLIIAKLVEVYIYYIDEYYNKRDEVEYCVHVLLITLYEGATFTANAMIFLKEKQRNKKYKGAYQHMMIEACSIYTGKEFKIARLVKIDYILITSKACLIVFVGVKSSKKNTRFHTQFLQYECVMVYKV